MKKFILFVIFVIFFQGCATMEAVKKDTNDAWNSVKKASSEAYDSVTSSENKSTDKTLGETNSGTTTYDDLDVITVEEKPKAICRFMDYSEQFYWGDIRYTTNTKEIEAFKNEMRKKYVFPFREQKECKKILQDTSKEYIEFMKSIKNNEKN